MSAWSARSALDYDFDLFVIEHEYIENPSDGEPNENDYKYLEYSELLLRAKEAGLGYRVEHNDTLHLVPTPIVKIDDSKPPQFHSTTEPAIRWKGGEKLYFLHGVKFEKDLWQKIVTKTIEPKELVSLGNQEQKMTAMKVYGMENMLHSLGAEYHSTAKGGEKLWVVKDVFSQTAYFLEMKDPSTDRVYVEGIAPDFHEEYPLNADGAWRWQTGMAEGEYEKMIIRA